MTQWFLKLPPEVQAALALQFAGFIFSCGVWWGTVRFLSKRVKEHDKHLEKHDDTLEAHGEDIAVLKVKVKARA